MHNIEQLVYFVDTFLVLTCSCESILAQYQEIATISQFYLDFSRAVIIVMLVFGRT